MGITQSGASQAIAQLETALGFQVFALERRYIGITVLGQQVIEHARAMLARLDAIRALADTSQGLNGARIRLASFPSVISTLLPGLLRSFRRRHPGIEVVAVKGTDEEVEDWLAAGTVKVIVSINASRPPEATVPLSFAPGEAAQVDFGVGPMLPDADGVLVRTWAFVMTLAFSRHPILGVCLG